MTAFEEKNGFRCFFLGEIPVSVFERPPEKETGVPVKTETPKWVQFSIPTDNYHLEK